MIFISGLAGCGKMAPLDPPAEGKDIIFPQRYPKEEKVPSCQCHRRLNKSTHSENE